MTGATTARPNDAFAEAGGPSAAVKSRGPWQIMWNKLRRDRTALFGGAILILLYLSAIFAGFLSPYSYQRQFVQHSFQRPMVLEGLHFRDAEGSLGWPFVKAYHFDEEFVETDEGYELQRVLDPSKTTIHPIRLFHEGPKEDAYSILGMGNFRTHLFGVDAPAGVFLLGTDQLGRDFLSRLLFGGQVSLSIGIIGILISMSLGTLVGGFSGYYSDRYVRLVEFPAFAAAVAVIIVVAANCGTVLRQPVGQPQVLSMLLLLGLVVPSFVGTRSNAFRAYLLAVIVAVGALVGPPLLATEQSAKGAVFLHKVVYSAVFCLAALPSLAWLTWRLQRAVLGTQAGDVLLFNRTFTVDFAVMRMIEVILAVPGLYMILTLRFAFGKEVPDSRMAYLLIIVILAFIGWASNARVIRGMVLSIKQREFVVAARALGVPDFFIIVKHVLPNTLSYVIVTATLYVPYYILGEVALSFLGIGIQEPESSWGLMLKDAQQVTYLKEYPWLVLPGLCIFVAVLAFNFLGDGLRDAADPRTVVAVKK